MNTVLDIALTNAAIATLLALGVALVTWRFRPRPAVRHALWLLVLIKLIAPPIVPIRVDLPASPAPIAATETLVEEVADPVWTEAQTSESELSPSDVVVWTEPIGVAGPKGTPVAPAERPKNGATGVPLGPATRVLSWRMVTAGIWLAGSIVWLSVATIRIIRFGRVLRDAKPASEPILEHVADVAAHIGLRRAPRVVMTSGAVSPLIWGFGIAPKLLIPNGLWSRLGHEQRTTLLIHELAHLRRGDHLVRLLELVVTGVYWWHPVAWWARRALRDAEEQCCDAWVVWAEPKSARSYATALLETVEFLSRSPGHPFAAPAAATGLGHVDHLKRRLTMILRGTTPRRLSLSGALAILGLAGVLLPLAPIAAQEEEKPAAVVTHESIKRVDVIPGTTEQPSEVTRLEAQKDTGSSDDSLEAPQVQPLTFMRAVVAFPRSQEEGIDAGPESGQDKIINESSTTSIDADAKNEDEKWKALQKEITILQEALASNPDNTDAASKLQDLQKKYWISQIASAQLAQAQNERNQKEVVAKAQAEVAEAQRRLNEALRRLAEVARSSEAERRSNRPEIIIGNGGGKPDIPLTISRMRINPDGRPEVIAEDVVGRIEGKPVDFETLAKLKAEKAALLEVLKQNKRVVQNFGTDPGVKHVLNQLAEIEARLHSIESSKYLRLDAAPADVPQTEEDRLRARLRSIEVRSQGRYDYPNDPAYKQLKAELEALEAKSNPQPNPNQRIDALEKKLDSVLDELKRLKGGEEGDKTKPVE